MSLEELESFVDNRKIFVSRFGPRVETVASPLSEYQLCLHSFSLQLIIRVLRKLGVDQGVCSSVNEVGWWKFPFGKQSRWVYAIGVAISDNSLHVLAFLGGVEHPSDSIIAEVGSLGAHGRWATNWWWDVLVYLVDEILVEFWNLGHCKRGGTVKWILQVLHAIQVQNRERRVGETGLSLSHSSVRVC